MDQVLQQAHGTVGYGGSGFKFDEEDDEVRRAAKKAQAKEYVLGRTSQILKMKMPLIK